MTTTKNTEASVLAHHGIAPVTVSDDARVDAARDAGVLTACLGCGSVVTAPEGMTTEAYKAANPWFTPEVHAAWAECCPDDDTIIY